MANVLQDVGYWQTQLELILKEYRKNHPEIAQVTEDPKPNHQPHQIPPPNVKPCRYGSACTRPDCKFWHPDADPASKAAAAVASVDVDVGAQCSKLGLSWVPLAMTIYLHENGKVSYGDTPDPAIESPVVDRRRYELYGVSSVILDPASSQVRPPTQKYFPISSW